MIGGDLAYVGRGEDGVARFRQAIRLAAEIGDQIGLDRAYANLTDALTMLGRPRESLQVAEEGLEVMRPVRDRQRPHRLESDRGAGRDRRLGRRRQAERRSAARGHVELPGRTAHTPRGLRNRSRRVRRCTSASRGRERHPAGGTRQGLYDTYLAELALWEHRWADAHAAVQDGLAPARQHEPAQMRVRLSAKGLRAQAELAGLARARPRRCAPRAAWPRPKVARRRTPRRGRGVCDHAGCLGLARRRGGRARACPGRAPTGGLVRGGGDMGATRTPAPRRVLSVARS